MHEHKIKSYFHPSKFPFPWPQLWLTCCRGQCQAARCWRREHGGDPPRLAIISYFPAPSYSSSFLYLPPSTPSFSFFQGWQIMETWEHTYNIIQPKHPLKNKFIMFFWTTPSGPTKNLWLDDYFSSKMLAKLLFTFLYYFTRLFLLIKKGWFRLISNFIYFLVQSSLNSKENKTKQKKQWHPKYTLPNNTTFSPPLWKFIYLILKLRGRGGGGIWPYFKIWMLKI